MAKHFYNGNWYTAQELADLSGIAAHTLRDRLRRGFSVDEAVKPIATHESVREFGESSWYEDWYVHKRSSPDILEMVCISWVYTNLQTRIL